MARSLRSIIKQFFQTGDVPTQTQYSDTIDSSVYWEDDVEHTLTNDADKVPASDAVYAAIGAVPVPNLNEVLAEGNETLGINIKLQNSDSIELDNTSVLRKGTYDFGGLGGISRICSVGYEDMWQSGIHHVFDNNGWLRESTNCFNYVPNASYDSSLRFQIGSRWVLDDGTLYVCADATVGYAVWNLIPSVPTLQQVTNAGASTTNGIDVLALNIKQATEQVSFGSSGQIDFTPDTTTPANKTTLLITTPTANNNIVFKDESGTVAFLSDITGAGVASVTGNIVDNTDPANPDASLTAANVHTFVDGLTALVTPADADKMIIVDNSTSLAKKITWANIKATLTTYFDGLYTAKNTTITGATKTKVTYDSKGLITSGADATTADIAASTNKNYVTDAQAVVIGNTSGTNTGDQTLAGLGGVAANAAITGATKTKITYDSKGLVTSGADATTSDIASSTDKRYVTDAQLTVIGNTSGTNSGNETTTTIGTLINGATSKTTPVDADQVGLMDSAASNILKKLSWANIKATLKTYFDGLYSPIATATNIYITTGDQSTSGTTNVGITGLSITTIANKRYAFEGYFRVGCSSTGGVKFTVTAPSGSTLNVGFMGPATPNSTNGIQQFINASGTQTAALANANSSLGIIKIYGEVSTGATTGTIQVGFASAVNLQTSTVYQNGTNIVYTER